MHTHPDIIAALDHERTYASTLYGGAARPVSEHLLLIEQYVRDAKTAWTRYSGDDKALHELRKAGAMLLQCLSEHGCPWRKEPFKNGDGQAELPQIPLNRTETNADAFQASPRPFMPNT